MTMHPLNIIKSFGLAALVAVIAVVIIAKPEQPDYASASAADNVHGWLWSDAPNQSDQSTGKAPSNVLGGRGLGWISVNRAEVPCSGPSCIDYGVRLNLTTGDFFGYGWSEYAGYLDFHPGTGGYPSGQGTVTGPAFIDPTCLSNTATTTCPVKGWIKFTGGGSAQSAGWDGWISMHGTDKTGGSYGVSYTKATQKFSGFAWGDTVTGWVDFSRMYVSVQKLSCTGIDGITYTYLPGDPVPSACGKPPLYLFCTDRLGTIYTYLLGSSLPTPCTQLTCVDATNPAITHSYPIGGTPPAACGIIGITTPPPTFRDACLDNQLYPDTWGIQKNEPFQKNGTWYGMVGGICIPDQCPDNPRDPNSPNPTIGFQANKPANYEVINGICQYNPTTPGGPGGPINPIYKEN